MKRFLLFLCVGTCLVAVAVKARAGEPEPDSFRIYWKEGIRLETADKAFKIKFGGKAMNDWAFFLSQDAALKTEVGNLEDGIEFSRARLFLSGTIYERVIFEAQYDFVDVGDDGEGVKDLYVGLKKIPFLGEIKVGHFKEPFSLEYLTNSKYITFMERALPEIFTPGRNVGIMAGRSFFDKRMTLHAGLFRETDGIASAQGNKGGYAGTVRLTGRPWKSGRSLLHLGIAYRYSNPADDFMSFDARPESHLAVDFADSGDLQVDALSLVGAELALVVGPFSVQGEFIQAFPEATTGYTYSGIYGCYAYASWFVTGESRRYKASEGKFARVRPKENFMGKEKGLGALEVAARYSHLDLEDRTARVFGGRMNDITAGINWYLNPNVRVMANYVFSHLDDVGDADIFQMRFQVDF